MTTQAQAPAALGTPLHTPVGSDQPLIVSADRSRRLCSGMLWTARAGLASVFGAIWLPLLTIVSFTVAVGSCNQKTAHPFARNTVSGSDVLRDRAAHGADSISISVVHTAQPYVIAVGVLALLALLVSLLPLAARRRALLVTALAGAGLLALLLMADATNSVDGAHSHIVALPTAGLGVALLAAGLLAAYPRHTGLRLAQGRVFWSVSLAVLAAAPFAFGAAATAFASSVSPPQLGGQVVVVLVGGTVACAAASMGLQRATRRLRAHINESHCWLAGSSAVALAMAADITAFGAIADVAGLLIGLTIGLLASCAVGWWILSDRLPAHADDLRLDEPAAAQSSVPTS